MNVDALFADVVWPFLDSAAPRVLREANANACPACSDLDGAWDADDDAAQPSHPACKCSFTPLDDNDKPSGRAVRGDAAAAIAGGRMVGELMANLSAAERKQIPDSDFAGPNRTFPCHDQAHVDAAVKMLGHKTGALYDRIRAGIKRIAKRKGLKLPDSWGSEAGAHSADSPLVLGDAVFAGPGTVTRRGRVFRAGDYPEQRYAMTPEDVLLRADSYAGGAPVKVQHIDTVFDGLLGTLDRFWLDDDGETVNGDITIPDWLNEALPDDVPLSMRWDPETQEPMEISLALNPIVTDAAMASYAAFAKRHDTPHGQAAMQSMHDHAASLGAVCSAANFASRHEATALQTMHDTAVSHGATCAGTNKGASAATYAASRREGIMGFFDAVFGRMTPEERAQAKADLDALNPTPATSPAPIAAPAQFSSVTDAERAELTRLRQERIEQRADAVIAAHKALPASKETLLALFSRAAAIDGSAAAATFSAGEPSTTALLERTFAELPSHTLTQELLDPNADAASVAARMATNQLTTPNPADAPATPMSQARIDELLGKTSIGEQVLNSNRGSR